MKILQTLSPPNTVSRKDAKPHTETAMTISLATLRLR